MTKAVYQEAIEDALIDLFSGIQIEVEGELKDVSVFMEIPANELVRERTYPAVSILFLSEQPDYDVRDSDDEMPEERALIEYDDDGELLDVPLREMRLPPEAVRMTYSIDTWNAVRAQTSRDLLFEVVRRRLRHRGYLTVKNVDGEKINVWMYWTGGVVPNHEVHPDMLVYHHSVSVIILAYLATVRADEVSAEKVATSMQWRVFSGSDTEESDTKLDSVITVQEDEP